MSLYRWFSSSSSKLFLPDPSTEKTKEKEFEVAKANAKVVEAMESQERCKRWGTYAFFTPEHVQKLGSEGMIRGFKKRYYEL